jgi:methylmalonyl-CoA mutase
MSQKKEKLFTEFPPVSTQEWEEKIKTDLKGADYEKKLLWKTLEGFNVRPYYRAEDIKNLSHIKTLPNKYPYVRGNKIKNNVWEIRQDIDIENIEQANKIALNAISRDANSIGFKTEKINNETDINLLLKNIDLTKISINFISSKNYNHILNLFINEVNKKNIDTEKINGSLNFDPIGHLLIRTNYNTTQDNDFANAYNIIKIINKKLPNFRAITINSHYFHNAGSSAVQELAFGLASANEYLAHLTDKGLSVDNISPKMQFSFAIDSNYFIEIAKLRAARLLWTKIVEQYKPAHEKSLKMFIHTITSTCNKTIYDPYVNILRLTTEAMSAAIGNCDSMSVTAFDMSFKNYNDFSSRIAQNIQLIIKEEAHFDKVIDPGAGSYYIENLTDIIANAAWNLFKKTEEKRGFIKAVKQNFIQNEIEKTRQKKNMNIAMGKQTILGTNQFPNLTEKALNNIEINKKYSPQADKKETIIKPLKLYRGAEEFENIRLCTEKFVKKGNKKPKVFLLTIGNPTMRKARAMFSTNFFGCAGYEIIDNAGFKTAEQGVEFAIKSNPNIIVICSSDDKYAELAPAIAQKLKEKNSEISVIIAGYPKNIIDDLKNSGIDDFIHIKTNILETLRKYQQKFGIM